MQPNGGGPEDRPPDGAPARPERRDDETETGFPVPVAGEPPAGSQPSQPPPPTYPQSQPPGYPQPPGYGQAGYYPQPPGYPQQGGYPQQPPGYPQPPGRRGSGRGLKVFLLLLLLLFLALIALIAGLASGFIKMNDVLRLSGMGPGEILVQNASDAPVVVEIERLDADGTVLRSFAETVGPADVRTYPDRDKGPWDLRFAAADGTSLGECNLQVGGNEVYTFIVLPDVIAVSRAGTTAASGDELVVVSRRVPRRPWARCHPRGNPSSGCGCSHRDGH